MDKAQTVAALRKCIDRLMAGSDAQNPLWNIEKVKSGKPNKWNYIDGCMMTAMLSMYAITGEKAYLQFADDFLGWFVEEDGSIKTYDAAEQNLDNVKPASCLFALYRLTGKEKYRRAMDTVYAQLQCQPRTETGNFWHKNIYPHQVWLDGLYMAQPFYMEYECRFDRMRKCYDIFGQFEQVEKHLRDEKTGLYYHGWDESHSIYWANPQTGCSSNFWLRALGWFAMALVDVLEAADEQMYYEYRDLQAQLKSLIDALVPWQDGGGMFWQVVDHPGEAGNYLETSGTAILSYAILKAVRLGFLPEQYRVYGEKAFYGTANAYLKQAPDGSLNLGGICLVAGLGGEQHRDGSRAYYYSEPVVENEAKGLAPMLLAMTEILRVQNS